MRSLGERPFDLDVFGDSLVRKKSPIAFDLFNGTGLVTAHPMNKGNGWTQAVPTATLNGSGALVIPNDGVENEILTDLGTSRFRVDLNLTIPVGAVFTAFFLKAVDAGNKILAQIEPGTPNINLYEKTGGGSWGFVAGFVFENNVVANSTISVSYSWGGANNATVTLTRSGSSQQKTYTTGQAVLYNATKVGFRVLDATYQYNVNDFYAYNA